MKALIQILLIQSIYLIFSFASSNECSLGCKSCSNQNQDQASVCSECKVGFQLKGDKCQCSPQTYLQVTQVQQNENSVNNYECKAICDNTYQEKAEQNVCDSQEQCSISYSRYIDPSINVGTIESIYMINSAYSLIVYPTYATLINTQNGQYLRDIISSTTLSTLYFKNYLIILSVNNEIIEWQFETNFQRLITKINMGKITKKTQFFDFGNNYQAISTYDEPNSIVFFTRIYLDGTNLNQNNIVSFTFQGCALKIVDNFVLCFGKDQKIQISKLTIQNDNLVFSNINLSSTCLNSIFNSNSILQSYFIRQDNKQILLLIQSLNNSFIKLTYDSNNFNLDCQMQDLSDQPQKFRFIDQKEDTFLFAVQFASKIVFYNQELSEIFKLITIQITDIAFVRDQAVSVLTIYKMLTIINSQNLVQTYTVNVEAKFATQLSTFPLQISNPLQFLTYNDKNIQKDQIQTILNTDNYNLFIVNDKLQSVNANTDYTNYIVTPFEQSKFSHTDSINEMVHADDSLFLITCSSDGQVKAWYTLNSLNPFHLYTVRQNNESCRTIIVHQNKWVVALFSRSILIFLLKNPFVRYSYPFTNPATDTMQFINQMDSNILLFYDNKFTLLKGLDLSELNKSNSDPSIKVIQLFFIIDLKIIVQSTTNLLEVYQFDSSNNFQFKKLSNLSYLSSYGDFATIQIDYISQSDFEIILGCKGKAFIILNSLLSQVFFLSISQGYPIVIKKFVDNNIYVFFGYCTEQNAIYLFFHYSVDRAAVSGYLFNRSYSLKHNQGARPLENFKNLMTVNYLSTMPFSYFTLILNCVYRPYDKTVTYGFFVYSMGKPITKYATKDNGQIQYYGSSDGQLSFDTTDFSVNKRLTLKTNSALDAIQKVKASSYLKSLFVLQTQVDIYNIYTHQFVDQIKFDSQFDNQKVQDIIVFEKSFIVIVYKTSQLIVRNLIDNSQNQITSISVINGVLLDKKNKLLYIYGSALKVFALDMTLISTISEEGKNSFQYCTLTANLLICKSNTNTLLLYNKSNLQPISNILIKSLANTFKIYIDEDNKQIYLATTLIQVYNFSGDLLSQIQSISLNILDVQLFGTHLCVLTSTYIFVFTRNTLLLMKQFKPSGGGNILGYYYIPDYNIIAYYADEIRFGQLFYFSLNNYLDDGFTTSTYVEMGVGTVITLFYDQYTSRLNYIDSQGNLYSINFLSQRSFYNVINFEDFKDLGSPTNYEIDHTFNKLYVYNKNIIMKFNHNVLSKYVILQTNKNEKFYFKYITPATPQQAQSQYFIFDKNNVLYTYKDFSQVYQTYFTNYVRNVKQLEKYQLILIIFDNEILFYRYDQVQNKQILSSTYIAKISDPKIRVFLTDELLLTTEQQLIHINYQFFKDGSNNWKKKVIDYQQYDESLRNYLKYGPDYEEQVFISFNSGRVILYNSKTLEDKVVFPAWAPQGGITTNFVKFLAQSASYIVFGYNYNFLKVIPLSNLDSVKMIDTKTITQQSSGQLNFLSVDEQNNRIFYSLMHQKLIYVIKLNTLELEQYLSFPNDQFNRMTMTSQYIFTYSIFQVNIFKRDSLQFVNQIKKSSSENRILTLTILEENKLILAMNVLLEVYLFNILDQSIILIDSSSQKNPEVIDAYMSNDESQFLRIVGISDSGIFEKRFNMKIYSQSIVSSQTTSVIQYSCYSVLNMNDRIQGENLFSSIYNKNNKNTKYRIVATFGQDIKSLDFIPDNLTVQSPSIGTENMISIIVSPDITNSQKILNLFYNSFIQISRSTIYLKDFSFKMKDNNKKYTFSNKTQNVVWQNIKIEQQDSLNNIQIVFNAMKSVTISHLTISRVSYNQNFKDTDSVNKWDQTLLLFVDCNSVIIDNLIIDNLQMWRRSLLIGFQRVNYVQINNFSIQNSSFYSLINVDKGQSFIINTFQINNNENQDRKPFGQTYQQSVDYLEDNSESYMLSIVGCVSSNISGVKMGQNRNILFLKYLNSYQNESQKVILYNDNLMIKDSTIEDTIINSDKTIQSKQIIASLINIEASNVQFNKFNYNLNQGNIQIQNSNYVQISNSNFEKNQSLEGGAIYFDQISHTIIITKSNFTQNIALGGGGAFFVKDITGITFDNESTVTKNQAQIGGGIRIVCSKVDPFSILQNKQRLFGNTADIFGQNIGIYPTQIKVSLSQSHVRLLSLKNLNSVQNLNRILQEDINLNDLRSGDQFPFRIKLYDDENKMVSFSLERLKENNYTQVIIDEIKSYSFEVQIVNETSTSISGQSFINYNQFNITSKEFEFTTLKINAFPQQMRSIKLISNIKSFAQQQQIKLNINLNFRQCKRGEVYKNITEDIITCEECQKGFYSIKDPSNYKFENTSNILVCEKCPPGTDSNNCEKDKLTLLEGYWRENTQTDAIYECNNERYVKSCNESSPYSKNGCKEGYFGPICEVCDEKGQLWGDRYTYVEKSQYCVKCDPPEIYYMQYVLASLGLMAYLTMNIIMFMNNFIYLSTTNYLRHMSIIPISSGCIFDQSTYYMKSLMSYIQISSILLKFNLKSPITTIVSSPNYVGSPATKVLADSHCIYTDSMIENYGPTQIKIFVQGMYPLTFLILICLMLYILAKMKKYDIKYFHIYAAITLLFTSFQPELITYFTKALSCRMIGDKKYVQLNLSIRCDDPSFNHYQYYFVIPYLILLIVIPLFTLKKLHTNRKKLNYCTIQQKYGYFYLGYKSNLYYWEFIRIYTRTILVIFYTLQKEVEQGFSYQIVSLILAVYLILNYKYKPYVQKQVFQVEIASICVLLINIALQQIDDIYNADFVVLQYTFHLMYVLSVILIILVLKLSKRRYGIFLKIINAFQRYLPQKIFNEVFKNRRSDISTFKRWLFLRKNISVLIRAQAKKISEKCEVSLSKQLTQSNCKAIIKQQMKRDTDSLANSLHNLTQPKKSQLQSQILQNMQNDYIKSAALTNFSPRAEFDKLNYSDQSPKISHYAFNIDDNKEGDVTSHDMDDDCQYEERPNYDQVKSVLPIDYNIDLQVMTKK